MPETRLPNGFIQNDDTGVTLKGYQLITQAATLIKYFALRFTSGDYSGQYNQENVGVKCHGVLSVCVMLQMPSSYDPVNLQIAHVPIFHKGVIWTPPDLSNFADEVLAVQMFATFFDAGVPFEWRYTEAVVR